MDLNETIKQLSLHAGGPGSGRHALGLLHDEIKDNPIRLQQPVDHKTLFYSLHSDIVDLHTKVGKELAKDKSKDKHDKRVIRAIYDRATDAISKAKQAAAAKDYSTAVIKNESALSNLHGVLSHLGVTMRAGGYGSGRHPYATSTMMDVLSHHDFEKTGNTARGNSKYENSSGDTVLVNHKINTWLHKESRSGAKQLGYGIGSLDNHLAKAYGNSSYAKVDHKSSLVYASTSISKAEDMISSVSDDSEETTLQSSFGIGSDSFHYAVIEVVPPKNTVPVENPGDKIDKKRRKSKKFRKYEEQLVMNQGHGPVMVTTQKVDNSDIIDHDRSQWFAGGPGSGRKPWKVGDKAVFLNNNVKIAKQHSDGTLTVTKGKSLAWRVTEDKLSPRVKTVADRKDKDPWELRNLAKNKAIEKRVLS